jgi:hypothetical protein
MTCLSGTEEVGMMWLHCNWFLGLPESFYSSSVLSVMSKRLLLRRGNVVGIATGATSWMVWRSNPGGERDFPDPCRPAMRPTHPPI